MGINLSNFLASKSNDRNMGQYQDLDHLDGLAISSVSANLYNSKRDDLAMFYFRDGANFASLYTQSKILSENIKWNLSQKTQKIFSLVVNTRNANSFTGEHGYKSMQNLADLISKNLINGCANITGGGLSDNIKRVLPNNLVADIDLKEIKTLKIFNWLKKNGISENEMLKTFNCGVGFCLIINKKYLNKIQTFFPKNYKPYVIGKIISGKNKVKLNGSINWNK